MLIFVINRARPGHYFIERLHIDLYCNVHCTQRWHIYKWCWHSFRRVNFYLDTGVPDFCGHNVMRPCSIRVRGKLLSTATFTIKFDFFWRVFFRTEIWWFIHWGALKSLSQLVTMSLIDCPTQLTKYQRMEMHFNVTDSPITCSCRLSL